MASTEILMPWRSFDEVPEHFRFSGGGRTITDTDFVLSAVGGGFAPLHSDSEWVRANTPFADRILPGTTTLHYGISLLSQTMIYRYLVIAFLGLDKVRAHAPVLTGDTISSSAVVSSKRLSSKDPNRGVVVLDVEVVNQRGEKVMTFVYSMMFRTKV